MKELIDKLESMTEKERNIYLDKCYQENKEVIDEVVNANPKDYEIPEGLHIIGSEEIEGE